MLFVADKSTVISLNKRTRSLPQMQRALNTSRIPPVYIFNVGPREFMQSSPKGTIKIPACKPGEMYSEPIKVDGLVLSEYDLGDSGGAMGTTVDPGLDYKDEEGVPVYGVADDIIGKNSTSAALDLQTTNLEWFGVFSTKNEIPEDEEIAAARGKLRQMMELIYAKGAELVQTNSPVLPNDRKIYNEAAEILGRKSLWGDNQHTMDRCPECKEAIISGATFCKHCQQPIDAASVAARAKKRAKANEDAA